MHFIFCHLIRQLKVSLILHCYSCCCCVVHTYLFLSQASVIAFSQSYYITYGHMEGVLSIGYQIITEQTIESRSQHL